MKTTRKAEAIHDLRALTADDVAEILQCSTKSLRRWCRKGKFPKPFYVGKFPRWRKPVSDEFPSRHHTLTPEK